MLTLRINSIVRVCRTQTKCFRTLKTKAMANIKAQSFDFFCVLDFEATCDRNKKLVPQEVIEFPILKVNGKTFDVEAEFHEYVEPKVHKELTPFCTELTGIIQEMVDGQPHLENVLQMANKWLYEQGLLEPNVNFTFVTCGDWDLKVMLPNQCDYFKIKYPNYFKRWINIKRPYSEVLRSYPKGMPAMLSGLGLPLVGRHHSGIDDCRNIAAILKKLAERGHVFSVTGQLAAASL